MQRNPYEQGLVNYLFTEGVDVADDESVSVTFVSATEDRRNGCSHCDKTGSIEFEFTIIGPGGRRFEYVSTINPDQIFQEINSQFE